MQSFLAPIFYFLVFAIPFGTRKLIWQFTEGFHEYEAVFFYGTDVLLILVPVLFWMISYLRLPLQEKDEEEGDLFPPSRRGGGLRWGFWALSAFILLSATSVFFAVSKWSAVYQLARLAMLVVFAFVSARLLRDGIVSLRNVFVALGFSAVFQAFIGFFQFVAQKSLGLRFLGESFLNTEMAGVAKIAVEGGRYLRAYGTLPHPNVLGAFLVIGLLSLCGLALSHESRKDTNLRIKNIFILLGIACITFGLVLTFSRAAWLVAIFSVLAITGWGFLNRERRSRALGLLLMFSFSAVLAIAPIRDLVFVRAGVSVTEPAVTARLAYNDLARDLIKEKPWGVGLGNQVLYSVKNGLYQKLGMNEVWMWQPIHNLYLLIIAETGIIAGAVFFAFLFSLLISNDLKSSSPESRLEGRSISLIMLLVLLILGLFDHYLWTLNAGQLMLWLIIGIIMGSGPRKHGLRGRHSENI